MQSCLRAGSCASFGAVMAGLVPAIHDLATAQDVDARAKPAHDGGEVHALQIEYTGWFKPSARCSLAHSCGLTLRSRSTPAARTRRLLASSAGGPAPPWL